jgi:hypothetical protein
VTTVAVWLLIVGLIGYLVAWYYVETEPRRRTRRQHEADWVAWAESLVDPQKEWNL